MQTNRMELTSSERPFAAGIWLTLIAAFMFFLSADLAHAVAPPSPIVTIGSPVQIGVMGFTPPGGKSSGGGWFGGESPLGGTFVIGANGNVIIGDGYANSVDVFEITPSGTQTVLASGGGGNSHAAAIDVYGNVYIAFGYSGTIYKLPYNSVTGAYVGYTAAPTANCSTMNGAINNSDQSACVFAPNIQSFNGISGMAIDGHGNLIIATSDNAYSGAANQVNNNLVLVCNAACEAETDGKGTNPPVTAYADSTNIGSIAVDPWGDIFYIDGSNAASKGVTNLNELPLQSGKYATAPTLVVSYTNKAGYGNGFAGLAVAPDGTILVGTVGDGIFGIPNSSSGPNLSGFYVVSNIGMGKGMAVDSHGNFAFIPYNSGDVISYLPTGSLQLTPATIGGTASTATETIIDSAATSTPTLTFAPTRFGVASTEFTASLLPGATCSAALGTSNGTFSPAVSVTGCAIPAVFSFLPSGPGLRTASLIITDSADNAAGAIPLSAVSLSAWANVDPGTVAASLTTGLTTPAAAVADPAGDLFVADAAGAVVELPAGKTTTATIGSGFTSPSALAFDANGDLFVADSGIPAVFEIPNVGTTAAFAAGTQSTLIGATLPVSGETLKDPSGLAVGPDGTLYIADTGNARVVAFNPQTGYGGLTAANAGSGLVSPKGLAIDASGDIYVADSGAPGVFIFSAVGVESTVGAVTGVTEPVGVAVDASGSVLIADSATGNIVRVPDLSSALAPSQAITVETISPSVSSLWMDSTGNIAVASASGKAAYAIQRSSASVNLGAVQDGLTNSQAVYLMNAGNQAATLGTPSATEPTNTNFTLAPAATNGCSSGGNGPAGSACQFTATFAPAVGTANGLQTGTATIDIATPSASVPVNLSGTASQSSVLAQKITGFNPPPTLQAGQQITLSATGGASGNPVVFTIDNASACSTCASISGSTLTALATGSVKVDANQAGGQANGNQYAAAPQVQASIAISNTVVAADVPALQMNQINWSYQSGAFTDGQNPAGGSFAVTQNGLVVVGTSYNNKADFVSTTTGNLVNQVSINGPGGFTTDSQNNLYMSHLYGPSVLKIPYVNGAYATLSDTSPPNCTGSDTTLCTFANVPSGGVKAIAFDPSGNFYMVTVPASPGASAIYECPASCQTGGTGTLLYSDVNSVSQVAFDPWGNLFFTEGVYTSGSNFNSLESASSNLNELPWNGTSFAATPTLLQSLVIATPANYDNQLDGLAIGSTGTIYYADQNTGMFAIPNTKTGGPDLAHQYVVSTLGAKGMELDSQGNEWVVVYHSGGDNIGEALLGDLATPNAQYQGAPVNAAATVVDNAFPCTTAATLAIASSNPEFAVTASGPSSCSTVTGGFTTPVSGATYPASITFTATQPNTQNATLTLSDTTNGGIGTATVTGLSLTTPQTLAFTAPTVTTYTYAPGETVTVSVTNGGSNNPVAFKVDSSSKGAGAFSSTTVTGTTSTAVLTITQAGSIVIDANEAGGLASGTYYDAAPQVQLTLTINLAAQAIVFPQPLSPVTYATNPSTTVTLSANGGASGNPVTFTVDPSSTGAGTISTSTVANGTSTATLTVSGAGNIVVDANQAATIDYAAAPPVSQTIVVNQASQSIVFTPLSEPFYYIATGATLSISATGGGSDNAIVFTVDPKSTMTGTFSQSTVTGATSAATLTMPPGQSPASGTIIVDANQTGNTNYLAATQTQFTINVGAPLPTQTITFPQPQTQVGGTTLTLTATASSGFPVTYVSGTTSVCTVSGSTATFAKVTSASACAILATQPGDNQYFAAAVPILATFAVNPAGMTPAMTLNLSLSSLVIEPGTVGLAQITVNSANNFAATKVAFTLSGLPSGYSYTFNPSTITSFAPNSSTGLPGGASATTTLSITPPASASAVRNDMRPLFPVTFAAALCLIGFRKRNRLQLLLLLVVIFAGFGIISGCGGSSGSSTPTPVTSNVTVTATGGGSSVTSSFSVTLE